MKSYTFKVEMKQDKWPDESEEQAVWRAWVPGLEHRGAASWGVTKQEALERLQDAITMVLEYMAEQGEPIPEEATKQMKTSSAPQVTVNV